MIATAAVAVHVDVERRQLDDPPLAGEGAREAVVHRLGRHRREEADPAEVDADHGDGGAEEPVQRPQHRPVAAEHDGEVGVVGLDDLGAGRLRTIASTARAGLAITSGSPWRDDGDRRTGQTTAASIQLSSSSGRRAPGRCDEVEEELTVSLRAGQARVYDAHDLRIPAERGLVRPLVPLSFASRVEVTTPPLPTSPRPASNCGFTSTTASQPGAASASAGGSASAPR